MAERWTAPETGWYRLISGREPEFLGAKQEPTAMHLLEGDALMNSNCPFAVPQQVEEWDVVSIDWRP